MAQTDKIVGNVYETFDYHKFSILPENRGQKDNKGLKERKLKTLQHMIDDGRWIHEVARVWVNSEFQIIDGAHTFEVSKRNNLPIRYEVTEDEHFNGTTKRELVGNVYSINSVTTSWTSAELFDAAVQVRAPLAMIMYEVIDANDNFFLWTDLMALLKKDGRFFTGRWRSANMSTFEDKALVEAIKSEDFKYELEFFVKLNLKCRIAQRKGLLLKAAYEVLWHAREHVNPRAFRKALTAMPESLVQSNRTASDDGCRRLLIQHYNKNQGAEVAMQAVIYALRHKDQEEPVEL